MLAGTLLNERQYVTVTNELTGAQRVEHGPQLLFPGAYDTFDPTPRAGFELQNQQYIKFLDQASGVVRVERGEKVAFPRANEVPLCDDARGGHECLSEVRDAVNVDNETAVLVRSKESGQQRLVVEKGLFFPGPYEDILDVQKLIIVEPHEVAIVRDNNGDFQFYNGESTGDGQTFFLPPYCELHTMMWSSGTSPEDIENRVVNNEKSVKYLVPVTKIDLRPTFAMFRFIVRTADFVEMQLEGTIQWQVVDVPRMIERTGDPKGDVWYQTQSAFIEVVSTVTLKDFMANVSDIVSRAELTDVSFYEQRGLALHGLEVVRYECTDPNTERVLQEITQETTNRINRLEKQKSENEVDQERMAAEIELETDRRALIEMETANEKLKASAAGQAEGLRLSQQTLAFFDELTTALPDGASRLSLLKFFNEQQTLTEQTRHLAQGDAKLFLTPQDVNLKLQMGQPEITKLAGSA